MTETTAATENEKAAGRRALAEHALNNGDAEAWRPSDSDRIYTGCEGRSVVLNDGTLHGYVTGFHKEGPHTVGAFVKIPIIDGAGPMLYVKLGREAGQQHREVVSVRAIDRDEFDRLNTLDTLRHDLGWR